MRRNRKRIIAALLAGFMVLLEIPAQVFAEEVKEEFVKDDDAEIEQETEEIPDSEESLQEQECLQEQDRLYEQEFLEEGVKVTLNDKEGVIPDQADVSITLVEENELEYIKGEIQNKDKQSKFR